MLLPHVLVHQSQSQNDHMNKEKKGNENKKYLKMLLMYSSSVNVQSPNIHKEGHHDLGKVIIGRADHLWIVGDSVVIQPH